MLRVMVVDDDPILMDMYEVAQKHYGFQIVGTASDGVEAIKIYAQINPRPDVIIMDQRMPNMCGLECTRRILRTDPLARIVFVSADQKVEQEALSSGAVDFIHKPFAMSHLMSVLEHLVGRDGPTKPHDGGTRQPDYQGMD